MGTETLDDWNKRMDERLNGMVRRLTIVRIVGSIPTLLLAIFFP